ncbi:MAG: hypothetical protein WBZ24_11370 [Anaerolineales bacterium]|jgi:hypothetical protein
MHAKSNVWLFTIIAFGFAWLFWVPEALIAQNIWAAPEGIRSYLSGPFNLAAWGPLLAALVATYLYQGKDGLTTLLKRGIIVRLGR